MTDGDQQTALTTALHQLRDAVAATDLPLPLTGVEEDRRQRQEMLAQLEDYLLPRVESLDAPLLAVVGGSTGAGKSTLVNSIVGETITRSGVLRPTTRASTLIHHPTDAAWFDAGRILPGLARHTGAEQKHGDPDSLRLVPHGSVPVGLALLDAPDIDSVVSANRDLARQLLSAADLWLFVTTAARYADAVPWELLHQAIERGTSVAVVLDRVPTDAMGEVRSDFAGMLMEQGLGQSPVFAIAETDLSDGLLPLTEVSRIRSWLASLASDAHARDLVIRSTLDGALDSLAARTTALQGAVRRQAEQTDALQEAIDRAFDGALDDVEEGMRDGTLLRGEVLARWQEFVGTGELLRQLDAGVGRLRDKVTTVVRGRTRTQPTEDLGEALQTGVAALLHTHAQQAVVGVGRAWRSTPVGASMLDTDRDLSMVTPEFTDRSEKLVRTWQGEVLEMVREEAGGRRTTARFLAFGVNGIAVMLMLLVFSATAGLSGAEVGIAGGSAILAQRLLEAIFGDQAVRTLSARARTRLLEMTRELYDTERERYEQVLERTGVTSDTTALDDAVDAVKEAR